MLSPAREKESVDEVQVTNRGDVPIVEGVSESSVFSVANEEMIVRARAFEHCSQIPEHRCGHFDGLRGLFEKLVVVKDLFDVDVEEFSDTQNKI